MGQPYDWRRLRAGEEAESAQLRAMSHPGTRISSLTKTHRHQRMGLQWVGWGYAGEGVVRKHTAPTSPLTSCSRLDDLFSAMDPHKSPRRPCSVTHHHNHGICRGRFAFSLPLPARQDIPGNLGICERTPCQRLAWRACFLSCRAKLSCWVMNRLIRSSPKNI